MSTPSFFIKIPYTLIGQGSTGRLGELTSDFDAHSALIITDKTLKESGLVKKITAVLKNTSCKYSVFDGCEPNAPSGSIERCTQQAINDKPDVLIGLGGGSVIDTTKIVSVTATGEFELKDFLPNAKLPAKVLPKIIIPTTAGTGSEWSRLALFADEAAGQKRSLRDIKLFADAVIIDPEMTLGMPPKVTADTGIDALSHGIEAYTSPTAHHIGDMFPEAVIKLVCANLLKSYNDGGDMEARYNMAVAASLGMASLTVEGGGLAHMMDGPVLSRAHISHGAALAILMPHVMERNMQTHAERYARLATLMGARISGLSLDEAAQLSVATFRKLTGDMGMKQRLRDVGINKDDLPQIADTIINLVGPRLAPHNPEDVRKILNAAL